MKAILILAICALHHCSFAQASYGWAFTAWNRTCAVTTNTYDAFAGNSGNVQHVASGTLIIQAGQTATVWISGGFESGSWTGYSEVVNGASQPFPDAFWIGSPCGTGAGQPPYWATNSLGTNFVWATDYKFLHVRTKDGKSRPVRIYRHSYITNSTP